MKTTEGIEWAIVLGLGAVLLWLGPKKIPELARGIGKAWGEFRAGKKEIEDDIKDLTHGS